MGEQFPQGALTFRSYYLPCLQEVDALIELSNALGVLVKSEAMKFVQAEVLKRTVFAALYAALSPTIWVRIAQLASESQSAD